MKNVMTAAIAVLLLAGCGKYEDGPAISLLTKKERITNTWQVSSAYQNGVDQTSDFNAAFAGYLLDIKKDNSYTLNYSPYGVGSFSDHGTWEFSGDKMEIRFTSADGSQDTYVILKLKSKEFWVQFIDDQNDQWEVHLVPKD